MKRMIRYRRLTSFCLKRNSVDRVSAITSSVARAMSRTSVQTFQRALSRYRPTVHSASTHSMANSRAACGGSIDMLRHSALASPSR
jgi:hypothetical protein